MSIPFAFAIAVRTVFASLRLATLPVLALGALAATADATPALSLPSCANTVNGAIVAANAATNPICTIALILLLTMLEMLETGLDSPCGSRANAGVFRFLALERMPHANLHTGLTAIGRCHPISSRCTVVRVEVKR